MNARKKKRQTRWVVSIVFVTITVALGGGWLVWRTAPSNAEPDLGQTVTAFVGTLVVETNASGRLLPQREAVLSFGIAGRVEQVFVNAGDRVEKGNVLVRLESTALQRAVRTAEQNLAIQEASLAELLQPAREQDVVAAEAAVAGALAQLDDLLAGPGKEELADSKAALASAEAALDELLAGVDKRDLAQASAALASAQALARAEKDLYAVLDDQVVIARQKLAYAEIALESAQYFYDALANDWQHKDYAPFSPEAERLENARAAYNAALAQYNLDIVDLNDSAYRMALAQVSQAKADLAALTKEKTVEIAYAREELALARANLAALTEEKTAQIASARAHLAQAEADLAKLQSGASVEELAIARAQVRQARIALEDAQARLADANLLAPFDGMITGVYVAVGEWIGGPAVELVDTGSLQVVLDVDETDIGAIAVGQSTSITLEAWPDQELEGKVIAIDPRASIGSGIVSYVVHINLETGDLDVRTGMTANADLMTSERENVLLVSNQAITADWARGKHYVYRIKDDVVSKVEVTLGLHDNSYSEIVRGLEKGDELVIGYVDQGLPFELKIAPKETKR